MMYLTFGICRLISFLMDIVYTLFEFKVWSIILDADFQGFLHLKD